MRLNNFKALNYSNLSLQNHDSKFNFKKILIANRGEIALRIMRTAKNMGIKCVAVFSEADKHSEHVRMADEAILIGPAPSSESYLNSKKIIDAMLKTGSEAVHPGYGFLSENFKFAQDVEKSGLNFIGPPSSAIKSMGSKSESKTIMIAAGVPCIPGYHGENQDTSFLAKKAEEIGYPIMIKAVSGGGGKGMRVATKASEFIEMLESAKRESKKSFDDDRVILEKYIKRSRHIEVQVFADKLGNCVYLFERDCSIQRRNQKIIEEAPAHGISEDLRKRLGETAVKAAKAVNYVGPGTVEFIYDCEDESFYFMEMNTRLQVEHPVTEMITGQDLVEWQINAAGGHALPLKQTELSIQGHSIEARIYAEIPECNFRPDTGKLNTFQYPQNSPSLRIETGVKKGDEISIYYDPMIAKVIAHGSNRATAIQRLDDALSGMQVQGVSTNIQFIQKILRIEDFVESKIDANFINANRESLLGSVTVPKELIAMASIIRLMGSSSKKHEWLSYFRVGSHPSYEIKLKHSDELISTNIIIESADKMKIEFIDKSALSATIIRSNDGECHALLGNVMVKVKFFYSADSLSIWSDKYGRFDFSSKFEHSSESKTGEESSDMGGKVSTSMPCKINQILVKQGDAIKVGTPLCVTEAMKMELVIKSKYDGVVQEIFFKEGDVVPDKSVLFEIGKTLAK